MRYGKAMILSLLAFLLAAPVQPDVTPMPPIGQRTAAPETLLRGFDAAPDAEEEAAVAAAARFPLGTIDNPVRVGGPEGERDYLNHLRCADGSRPTIGVRGERGVGAFGTVVAGYQAQCAGQAAVTIVLDMYHEEARETRAPDGFVLAR